MFTFYRRLRSNTTKRTTKTILDWRLVLLKLLSRNEYKYLVATNELKVVPARLHAVLGETLSHFVLAEIVTAPAVTAEGIVFGVKNSTLEKVAARPEQLESVAHGAAVLLERLRRVFEAEDGADYVELFGHDGVGRESQ